MQRQVLGKGYSHSEYEKIVIQLLLMFYHSEYGKETIHILFIYCSSLLLQVYSVTWPFF